MEKEKLEIEEPSKEEVVAATDGSLVVKKKKKRIKFKDRTLENDISYRAPLSYRSLRIIGWSFMILTQVAVVLSLAMKINKDLAPSLSTAQSILDYASTFPLPLLLLANFAYILQGKANFKKLLLFYGGMALLLYTAAFVLITHFVMGFSYQGNPATFDFMKSALSIGDVITAGNSPFYIFNIFIDLFLCALMYYFIFYEPKKHFQGKKIIIFRLFILLPILYEIGSILIKYYAYGDVITIPYFVFFLLTAKPPFMFVAFILIILVTKIQTRRFLKRHNHDKDMLNNHLETNAHSFKVSITIFWVFLLCGILDIVLLFAYSVIQAMKQIDPSQQETAFLVALMTGIDVGFGESVSLVLIAPLSLLFSYSRKPKNPKYDKFVPIIAIAIIILVYVEGFYRIISYKFSNFLEWITELISGGGSI